MKTSLQTINNSGKRISHPQMVLAFYEIFQTTEDPK